VPENVLLGRDGSGRPIVKLIDLGLARASGDAFLVRDGVLLDKVRYASPEHLEDSDGFRKLDARSDLYSLGVLLYELLTGVSPIRGDDSTSLVAGHIVDPIVPFEESDPEGRVPEALRQLLMTALAKDRRRRVQSAEHFLSRLAVAQAGIDASDLAEETKRLVPKAAPERPLATAPPPPPRPAAQDLRPSIDALLDEARNRASDLEITSAQEKVGSALQMFPEHTGAQRMMTGLDSLRAARQKSARDSGSQPATEPPRERDTASESPPESSAQFPEEEIELPDLVAEPPAAQSPGSAAPPKAPGVPTPPPDAEAPTPSPTEAPAGMEAGSAEAELTEPGLEPPPIPPPSVPASPPSLDGLGESAPRRPLHAPGETEESGTAWQMQDEPPQPGALPETEGQPLSESGPTVVSEAPSVTPTAAPTPESPTETPALTSSAEEPSEPPPRALTPDERAYEAELDAVVDLLTSGRLPEARRRLADCKAEFGERLELSALEEGIQHLSARLTELFELRERAVDLAEAGDFAEARTLLDRARTLMPGLDEQSSRLDEAERRITEIEQRGTAQGTLDDAVATIRQFLQAGEVGAARRAFAAARRVHGSEALNQLVPELESVEQEQRIRLARLCIQTGDQAIEVQDLETARRSYERATQLDPDNGLAKRRLWELEKREESMASTVLTEDVEGEVERIRQLENSGRLRTALDRVDEVMIQHPEQSGELEVIRDGIASRLSDRNTRLRWLLIAFVVVTVVVVILRWMAG
jgi:serine/threonine-protein kinase